MRKKKEGTSSAISYVQLKAKKMETLEFEGEFLKSFGKPELTGCWVIYGKPKNGKTSCALKILKYVMKWGKGAYDTLEEGASKSFFDACERAGMEEVNSKFLILNKESIIDLKKRLRKQRAPRFIVIDSLRYSRLTTNQYKELINEFTKTLFIIIAHSEGTKLIGQVAVDISFDAFITIYVEGFTGYVTSRYGGGENFIIDKERADKFDSKKI